MRFLTVSLESFNNLSVKYLKQTTTHGQMWTDVKYFDPHLRALFPTLFQTL